MPLQHFVKPLKTSSKTEWRIFIAIMCLGLMGTGGNAFGAAIKGKQSNQANQPWKPVAPPPPRSALLTVEDWQKVPLVPLVPGEIDQLISRELQQDKIVPALLTPDEQFIRRVTLDLTGQLPMPADVTEFMADTNLQKRALLVEKLLNSEEYASHWAHYWRDVIAARITDPRGLILARSFETWLTDQFQKNRNWALIARAMITAEGPARFDEAGQNGASFFLASHRGADAANERAAETSRVFLGIQIQCAQCHDHPSDQWKRVQFHELAGYFARMSERPVKVDQKLVGISLVSTFRGEHEMPSKEDPKKTFITHPRFLDGRTPGQSLNDKDRRKALADAIVQKNNYWFAGAYVNRVWCELMGQSFYQPVDDMGPKKEAVFPTVLTRLTASFRASNYNVKLLFRDIMSSDAYQRQIRLGESADQHLHFAAAYPTRLRPDALWHSLVDVLGSLGGPAGPAKAGPFAAAFGRMQGLELLFNLEFDSDPSLKADEVEGSVSQALLMMNNPLINQRIRARGTNLLARILKSNLQTDDALQMLYLRTMARKPTDREQQKCREFITRIGNRAEAFEDLLWALLNSTEFQTKR